MKDINDFVVTKWAPQWKQLGRQLKINQDSINVIQQDCGNDCIECCTRMLETWLEQNVYDDATWEILICAIDNLPIDLTGVYISNNNCNVDKSSVAKLNLPFTYKFLRHIHFDDATNPAFS